MGAIGRVQAALGRQQEVPIGRQQEVAIGPEAEVLGVLGRVLVQG